MSFSKEELEILYELSLSIGQKQQLHKMLRAALLTYIEKLNCVAALVYKTEQINGNQLYKQVFTFPSTFNIKSNYNALHKLFPEVIKPDSNEHILQTMQTNTEDGYYHHTMPLESYGYLILIKKDSAIPVNLLDSLARVNQKLSLACSTSGNYETLIESEKKYRDLTDLLPEMICETDLSGYITFANSYALNKLGYTKADIETGFNVFNLFPTQEIARAKNNFGISLRNKSLPAREYQVKKKNGELFSALLYTNQVISGKKVSGIRGVMIDISERKKMEQKLRVERDRANAANKAKSEFLANMNHEIRTPLNAILGHGETLQNKVDSTEHRTIVKSILNSANLLLKILSDILELSRIEAEQIEVSLEPVNLNYQLQELVMPFKEKANYKGLAFKYSDAATLPKYLMLDKEKVNQLISHLIDNAIKFTNEGHVHINCEYIDDEAIGNIEIKISDTGIGIPKNQHKSIFEVFKQQSGEANRQFGGTGLGLAISKKIVEKMNGSIRVKSVVGKGSTFVICLPAVNVSQAFSVQQEQKPNATLKDESKKDSDEVKSDTTSKELSYEQLHKIPELFLLLSGKHKTEWESLKNSLVLYKIEEFASSIKQVGISYGIDIVEDYADKILDALRVIDLNALRHNLQLFPKLLKQLESLIPPKQT